jgi:uroporphyrinogen decarboxylase
VLMALFTEPGPIDSALRTMTESLRTYGERIRDTGVGSVFIDSSSAGGELMSREMYERHDRPCLKAIIDSYRSLGLKTIVHNDSTMPMWQSQMEIDPDALHLHLRHVDRDVLFKAIKGHACLFAGIDHQELIFKHTPSEIDESVRGTLEQWGGSPGIVIAPGCELPYKTPRDNIQALKEAVIKHSSRTL